MTNDRTLHRAPSGAVLFGGAALAAALFGALLLAAPAHAAENPGKQAEQQLKFGVEMARRELWSEALFRFRQAAKLDPGNAGIFNNLAVAYEATGQFSEALDAYRQGLKISPSDQALKNNYARFLEFYQAYEVADEDDGSAAEGDEDASGDGGDEMASTDGAEEGLL